MTRRTDRLKDGITKVRMYFMERKIERQKNRTLGREMIIIGRRDFWTVRGTMANRRKGRMCNVRRSRRHKWRGSGSW